MPDSTNPTVWIGCLACYYDGRLFTVWGPERVSWTDTADPASTGTTQINTWGQHMVPVEPPEISLPQDSEESSDRP